MGPGDPRYREFVRLFNREEFFEAHDVLEELWRESGGSDRDFYQGLIQFAAALEHRRRGNLRGAAGVVESARRHLLPYGPTHLGVELACLLADTARFLDQPNGATPPRLE
jgi:predicted metal-dependent hydrolase